MGAGLAGLTAARAVRDAGRSVLVLEARHRVGGRNIDRAIGSGAVVELGGQWAGPGQDRVLGLAKELGVATFPTYSSGHSLYYRGGRLLRYTGDVPPAAPASLGDLETAILALNGMARSVRPDRPWTAAQAARWDRQTIGAWIGEQIPSAEAQTLMELAVGSVYGEQAAEISLLDLLSAISGVGGDINTLIGSAQSIRFVGGPQQLSVRLAHTLGAAVRLGMPVAAVDRGAHVTVHTPSASFSARRVILTLPKPLIGRIAYSPPLPAAHDQLLQRQPMGSVVKVNAVYPATVLA